MLGTIIEKLSSFISKSAFLTSFIPLLSFVVFNAALLAFVHVPFREWLLSQKTNPEFISAAVIFFLLASLVFATINTRLREIMEGQYWPAAICRSFTEAQQRRLDDLNQRYSQLQQSRRVFDKNADSWTPLLLQARQAEPKAANRAFAPNGVTAKMVGRFAQRRRRGEVLTGKEMKLAYRLLRCDLRFCRMTDALDAAQNEFVRNLIGYARAKVGSEIILLFNERRFNFPAEQQFNRPEQILGATAMGNIALSIRSYSLSRYRLDIVSLWTRLQKVMQGDAFYVVLQDSKTQLDFLVSAFWLVGVSTAAWLLLFGFLGYSLRLYLVIALAGSFSLWALYRLALQNYRAFADLMRSSVDLFRLRLLKELQLPEPRGSLEESLLWDALQNRTDYGRALNLTYRRSSE